MLTKKVKSKRKSEKELKSFKNKMGDNLIWFNSLPKQKQYDILFMWKEAKYRDSQDTSKIIKIWNYKTRKPEILSRKKLKDRKSVV